MARYFTFLEDTADFLLCGDGTLIATKLDGTIEYTKDGFLHRENGPALIMSDYEEWHLHGNLHRINGPAVTRFRNHIGYEMWFLRGKHHRVGGPAITYYAGGEYWYEEGESYIPDDLCLSNIGL